MLTLGKLALGLSQPPLPITDGGGGGEYVAQAVHFDGDAVLENEALSCTQNQFFSFSFWSLVAVGVSGFNSVLWGVDPENLFASGDVFAGAGGASSGEYYYFVGNAGGDYLKLDQATGFPIGPWTHVCGSMNTLLQTASMVVDGVLQTTEVNLTSGGSAFSDAAFNGLSFYFGSDTFPGDRFIGDVVDPWFAPGQYIDFSDPANVAKFRDPVTGKPVFLGNNGQVPTGTAPAVFFSGDASTFGTNLGSGGDFTLTGSLTNASTSPSD